MTVSLGCRGDIYRYRDADYYYTLRVAARLQTNWSNYNTMGGDFDWEFPQFHDSHTLTRNPYVNFVPHFRLYEVVSLQTLSPPYVQGCDVS